MKFRGFISIETTLPRNKRKSILLQWNYRRLIICRSESNRIKNEFITANGSRTFWLFFAVTFALTVRRDKIELVRLGSVRLVSIRFENLFSFTVLKYVTKISKIISNGFWIYYAPFLCPRILNRVFIDPRLDWMILSNHLS